MQRRKKVGLLLDRRFGENDPTMTPEEKAAERFARESQKKIKKDSLFNLEDYEEEEEELQLTHKGQSLNFDQRGQNDDFRESDLEVLDDDGELLRQRKRRRLSEEDDMEGLAEEEEVEEEQSERKKSKHEVMKEVIAKSKFHKHERQKAKEDDEDLREILDKGLPDIFDLMRGVKRPAESKSTPIDPLRDMNPDRAALLNGGDKRIAEREYDMQLKQMAYDKRSKPTERTKTQEEKAAEEAERLKKLEDERLRRMRGEQEEVGDNAENDSREGSEEDAEPDDAKTFGLRQTTTRPETGAEDEDDFIIDKDLVESDSEADLSVSGSDIEDFSEAEELDDSEADDTEFVGALTIPGANADKLPGAGENAATKAGNSKLAFTYPCPGTHQQFLDVVKDADIQDLPTIVQRIRALYHPKLHGENKAKLGAFSKVLIQHTAYIANAEKRPPFAIIENLLRHIHSLAKSHPDSVSVAFRAHLRDIAFKRPLELLPGDLVVLTGIGIVFPTSDHFHPVVTPSVLSMTRYLGQSVITRLGDIASGVYIASLCLSYQAYAKRYVPEFVNFAMNSLRILAPNEPDPSLGSFPVRQPITSLRLKGVKDSFPVRKLRFWDIAVVASDKDSSLEDEELKIALLGTLVSLVETAAELWSYTSAFSEVFGPARDMLLHLNTSCSGLIPSSLDDQIRRVSNSLQDLLNKADLSRRPLLLHYHRPLAIKTAIPKFEETFNPSHHYDPDRERAEINKLKAEHKRERKGAMRELRKDANFMARENLREKREKDAEYERKYRRLVADIQNEEGREANAYEKEKKARQGKW